MISAHDEVVDSAEDRPSRLEQTRRIVVATVAHSDIHPGAGCVAHKGRRLNSGQRRFRVLGCRRGLPRNHPNAASDNYSSHDAQDQDVHFILLCSMRRRKKW